VKTDIQQQEVLWAEKNGYRHRIKIDSSGKAFVIGDWSWNRHHEIMETIEPLMQRDGIYDDDKST